ncbi:MAG: hypothetical protein ACSHXJ_14445 [Marinomonas colpomeniae]
MFLSQYLKNNMTTLYDIKGSLVGLLVVLQLAVWYPLISQNQEEMEHLLKQKDLTRAEWEGIKMQSKRIEQVMFSDVLWATQEITSTTDLIATQLKLEGVASIFEWQAWLERVEELFALGVMLASWKLEPNGEWGGRLLFDIKAPKKNREYHNWLPTKLRIGNFVAKDWSLLSIMRVGEKTSALLEYKRHRHWVRQGSWLPSAGLSVETVSFDQITLMSKDGTQRALIVRETGEGNE